MSEIVTIGNATLYHGDCREILPTLGAVDAVVTDPPYFRVKGDYWDNEWEKPGEFLDWMRGIVGLCADAIKPNGSLYLFASPQMAGRVESVVWERMNVLNHITWRKGAEGKKQLSSVEMYGPENFRGFVGVSERIIFAEHYNSDNFARGESSYVQKCDELRGFVFEPLRAYLAGEWERAGLNKRDAEEATGTQMAGHWFTTSQWALPTQKHYETLRERANRDGGEFLRREYEFLRREYEDLRREYEDLRRPFNITARDQWSDVWDFDPVAAYPGKHPCEKPVPLLSHILRASTRPDALVVDCFMGSGATIDAALQLGRRAIGIERDRKHFDDACQRIENAQRQERLFA